MDHQRLANIVRLASRVPLAEAAAEDISSVASILKLPVPTMPSRVIMERSTTTTASASSSTCTEGDNSAACEKPVSESSFTLPIALGVIIPVVGAIILFTILSRRHSKKQREEDANDPTKNLDFGMGDVSRARKGPNVNDMELGDEKGMGKGRQVSLDLTNASPYLLPPELQNSRESLQSLSKSIHKNEDPYRPVTENYGDGISMRPYSKQGRDGASIMTTSSAAPSRMNDGVGSPKQGLLSNAAAMSQTTPPSTAVRPPRQNPLPSNVIAVNPPTSKLPPIPTPGSIESPITGHVLRNGLPGNPRPRNGSTSIPETALNQESYAGMHNSAIRNSNNYLGSSIASELHSAASSSSAKASSRKEPPPAINTLPKNPKPTLKEPEKVRNSEISDYGDGIEVTPPSPVRSIAKNKAANRYSMDVPPEEFVQAGLGAPGFDAKRLSMGFRPLPPDAPETEDPETRANRIRSFYKEYFDDSKPAPKGQYIEDYDQSLGGDAAYFDPASNTFVMPYAEPVTRRAMTPPPRMPRLQAPPPRSMRGPMSDNEGPRASSSASQRVPVQQPKRPIPPPAALTSLPTPSKLKDDSFMQSIEFAPELTVRDRAAGRSESPFGERRPYSPAVPVFAPVVSSFDELAAMPSPHMLRKSGTFTSLDFAAPKRFKDPENMSDAGSIRSARSGISAAHQNAIRNGAYRVSKIPQDAVFTRDDMAATLKPQWGMRSGS